MPRTPYSRLVVRFGGTGIGASFADNRRLRMIKIYKSMLIRMGNILFKLEIRP